MADLLRQGATLTELSCPACSSPLFKVKSGDLRIKEETNVEQLNKLGTILSTLLENLEKVRKIKKS